MMSSRIRNTLEAPEGAHAPWNVRSQKADPELKAIHLWGEEGQKQQVFMRLSSLGLGRDGHGTYHIVLLMYPRCLLGTEVWAHTYTDVHFVSETGETNRHNLSSYAKAFSAR